MIEKKNIVLTDKKYQQLFRAAEIRVDENHLNRMLVPSGYDVDCLNHKKVEYFSKYGFKVYGMYSDIYEKYNGIASEKYIPASLYYYYVMPFLCNLNFMEAYVDKNMYSILFPEVKQPQTIIKCINGRYFDDDMHELCYADCVTELKRYHEFIVKPSIETGGGEGVRLVDIETDNVETLIKEQYSHNWIAQIPVTNSTEMARFNGSSVNTMRIYTYRPVGTTKHIVLGSTLRFGGKGANKDNACSGGGFAAIDIDGNISNNVRRFADFRQYTTADFGFLPQKLSMYGKATELCLSLHSRLPYFDLIGWDICIDEKDELVLLEFNKAPDCEHIQIAHGPMFGDYTDDLMEAIKEHKTAYTVVAERSFSDEKQYFERYFDFKRL